ncbi:hypothetical protein [Streptomyces sp. NPDC056480]|uniref:hypothetical protein n=1 Tax=Streptomyces sp. NPDC056480 TaxID=3345833 RepID=UPI00368C2511
MRIKVTGQKVKDMKRTFSTLLTLVIASGALVTGTAGSAQAASSSTCTLWESIHHGNRGGYSLSIRSCIEWSGTSADRAYTEVRNIDAVNHRVSFSAHLDDDDYNDLASKRVWDVLIAPTKTARVYTNWVDDYTWGSERASGVVHDRSTVNSTDFAVEPWF